MDALKFVLAQYDEARDQYHQRRSGDPHHALLEKGDPRPRTPDHDDAARRLAGKIQKYCDDIWQTLKVVTKSVGATIGSALPAPARA
ncbi:transcriptional regulator opi1, partial [Teratosphaeriaceae sp. CCFEE 6253]